jgi:hypothetical protein
MQIVLPQITGDLNKLTRKENYGGHDQVHIENGTGMTIQHIGQSMVPTPSPHIILKDVLHVPHATRSLASVHLTFENDVFLELHPNFFLIKDRHTRHTVLYEPRRNSCIQFPLWGLHPTRYASVRSESKRSNAMVTWVIHCLRLLVVSFMIITFPLCPPNRLCTCVTHVNKARVTRCIFCRYPIDWVPPRTSFKSRQGAGCASTRYHASCSTRPGHPA